MLLFEILLAFIGISHLAHSSPPKIIFQQLLDTCTTPAYYNSTQCQYFFSTYPWQNDDIELVLLKVLSEIGTHRLSALNGLEERLIRLIENPNFDLASLGKSSFNLAVVHEKEPLAIAIWSQLEKYKNQSWDFYEYPWLPGFHDSDLQLFECGQSMFFIVERNMLQLLKKMVADQPDCLLQYGPSINIPLYNGSSRDLREFLVDHGVEIIPRNLQYLGLSPEGFEWALLNYQHSNVLIKNSIRNGSEIVAVAIWEFLKQKNCNDLLFQICNNTVFDVVNTNKVELLKGMLRYCPDSIHSNGNTLMGIAINGDQGSMPMIQLLNLYGVEIPPNYLHKAQFLGYTGDIDPDILDYHPTQKEIGVNDIVYNYFMKAVEENKKEICKKVLDQNIP